MAKINGITALQKMKLLQAHEDSYFVMHHLTYDSTRDTTRGLRIVEKCRLRPALPAEFSNVIDPDMLLPYMDLKNDKHGQCYKKLIRKVAFPPNYELLKVDWYD